MVEINSTLRLARTVVFATTSVFALIVIILGGLVTNFFVNSDVYFIHFAGLAIATGLLTLLTLPAMLALSIVRKGAFTSMIGLEIGWIWFLWIMWIAVGGNSVIGSALVFIGNCGRYRSDVRAVCHESSAITAFGFLSWVMLMFYCSVLFGLAFRQHLRGNTGIWREDITAADFTAVGGNNNPQIVYDNKAIYPNQYPPAVPQQGGVPYQTGSPYQPPQAPILYSQPQGATGSFTHPQGQPHGQTGPSPYPQV